WDGRRKKHSRRRRRKKLRRWLRRSNSPLAATSTFPPAIMLSHPLLDRRSFLGRLGVGLGGIALTSLLAEHGLLAADVEGRPEAPRKPHFTPRASRVLHVFCTGAVSHLDTWDYKPELIKRHGQAMPGVDKLVTFQGENGNLAQSPWRFRPQGESGKYVSDLLPHLAECVDDLC